MTDQNDSLIAEQNSEQKNAELEENKQDSQVDLSLDSKEEQRKKTLIGIEKSAFNKAEQGEMSQEYFNQLPTDLKAKIEEKHPDLFKEEVEEKFSAKDVDKIVEEKLLKIRESEEFEKLKKMLPEQVSPEQKEVFDKSFNSLRTSIGNAKALKYAALESGIQLKSEDPVQLGMELERMSPFPSFTPINKKVEKENESSKYFTNSLPKMYRDRIKK